MVLDPTSLAWKLPDGRYGIARVPRDMILSYHISLVWVGPSFVDSISRFPFCVLICN